MLIEAIDSQQAREWLSSGEAVLVDVREPDEFRGEHIPGAISVPLSQVARISSLLTIPSGKKVIFQCLKGGRGEKACEAFHSSDAEARESFNLAGGITAWKAAGLPVIGASLSAPRVSIFRQVQITVGLLVLFSVLAGYFVTPVGFAVAAFFGAALAVAGISGWCGLALALGRMPWNKAR